MISGSAGSTAEDANIWIRCSTLRRHSSPKGSDQSPAARSIVRRLNARRRGNSASPPSSEPCLRQGCTRRNQVFRKRAKNSSRSLLRGNGVSGIGKPRNAHRGAQPSFT